MRTIPFIAARDVPAASRWYQQLLGCGSDMDQTHPHRREYDRIVSYGQVILQFHAWDEKEHDYLPSLAGPDAAIPGHGVVLEFMVDDYEAALERARSLSAEVLGETTFPDGTRASSLRDLNGYVIVLAAAPDAG